MSANLGLVGQHVGGQAVNVGGSWIDARVEQAVRTDTLDVAVRRPSASAATLMMRA